MSLPNLEDYWEFNTILSQPGIVKGMSRNRFEQLCGRLHFNDNSLAPVRGTPGYDKLYKIRPIIDAICDYGEIQGQINAKAIPAHETHQEGLQGMV